MKYIFPVEELAMMNDIFDLKKLSVESPSLRMSTEVCSDSEYITSAHCAAYRRFADTFL